MYSTRKTKTNGNWLRRVLAAVLVVSMVVIPVNFPGTASALSQIPLDITTPNYFADDFSSSQHLDGVKYQWKTNAYGTSLTKDGVYASFDGATIWLKAASKEWTVLPYFRSPQQPTVKPSKSPFSR